MALAAWVAMGVGFFAASALPNLHPAVHLFCRLPIGRYVSPISEDATARVTRVAAWLWFCADSPVSVLAGAPMNAVINASFLALMLFASKPYRNRRQSVALNA